MPESGVVARLNGDGVSAADFRAFLDRVRGTGYKPATRAEADRLLRMLLKDRLVDQEAHRGGQQPDPQSRDAALARLVGRYGAPILVTEQDVAAFYVRHEEELRARGFTGPNTASSFVRGRIVAERQAVQRDAVLESGLKASSVDVDEQALAKFAAPSPTTSTHGIPAPPGFADGGSLR